MVQDLMLSFDRRPEIWKDALKDPRWERFWEQFGAWNRMRVARRR